MPVIPVTTEPYSGASRRAARTALPALLRASILPLLLWAPAVFAQDPFSETQLTEMAKAFIDAKNARQQPDSNAEDIERFLALFADDFVDEHIKFNVTVTDKRELRDGMLRKLDDEVF